MAATLCILLRLTHHICNIPTTYPTTIPFVVVQINTYELHDTGTYFWQRYFQTSQHAIPVTPSWQRVESDCSIDYGHHANCQMPVRLPALFPWWQSYWRRTQMLQTALNILFSLFVLMWLFIKMIHRKWHLSCHSTWISIGHSIDYYS